MSGTSVLVSGATGVVGPFLLRRLSAAGHGVLALSRHPPRLSPPGPVWREADFAKGFDPATALPRTMVHAAPLWLLPPVLPQLAAAGVQRLVAFSSTSRFSKQSSPSTVERAVAQQLADSEEQLAQLAAHHGVVWTIFRPTLIYGGGRDRNVADIARLARRLGVAVVAGGGSGRRQPVHADDLAAACLAVFDRPSTHGRSYDLAGGETLSYREMAWRVARAVTRRPLLVRLPLPLARAALRALSWSPRFSHLTVEMAQRMNEDLVFDDTRARADFGWAPRGFDLSLREDALC